MALLCDYFTAASASDAEATLDWTGGPSSPPPAKGLLRRGRSAASHRTVSLPGMEPTMWMGRLEEVLTGQPFNETLADPSGKVIAIREGGERLIVPVTNNLQDALAALPDDAIGTAAAEWAEPDEYYGTGTDSDVATGALRSLVGLVRTGRRDGEALYCWVCV